MCKEFFEFWHEPLPGYCALVKPEWEYECTLRVRLIAEKGREEWDKADITQDELDKLFPDLDAVWRPTEPKPVVKPKGNPWLRKNGVYDLLDPEVKRITDAFNQYNVAD